MTIAIVAGLVGAFILGGIAFGVGVPMMARMHAATVDRPGFERMQPGDADGFGPRGWRGEEFDAQRDRGMMGPRDRGMMGPRGRAPQDCPQIDGGTPACPGCEERFGELPPGQPG